MKFELYVCVDDTIHKYVPNAENKSQTDYKIKYIVNNTNLYGVFCSKFFRILTCELMRSNKKKLKPRAHCI